MRYFHTKAGREAHQQLSSYHLENGSYFTALLCYEKLLKEPEDLPAETLFKAAKTARHTGDKDMAERAWKLLSSKIGPEGLRVGDRVLSKEEVRKELDKIVPEPSPGSFDWPMYRGNPSRSAQSSNGGAPFLAEKWKQTTIHEARTRDYVMVMAVRQMTERNQAVLPAFFPVAVTMRRKGADDAVPLLIYRSYQGIDALNLKTGKLQWAAELELSLDRLLKDINKSRMAENDMIQSYLQSGKASVLFGKIRPWAL